LDFAKNTLSLFSLLQTCCCCCLRPGFHDFFPWATRVTWALIVFRLVFPVRELGWREWAAGGIRFKEAPTAKVVQVQSWHWRVRASLNLALQTH
jgi:hypothetical protein